MPKHALVPRHKTSPLIWCAAIICAIIAIAVVISGVVVFLGYLSIRPRVPRVSVTNAHIDTFNFDQVSLLTVQVSILIRFANHNAKAQANFYHTGFDLRFHGKKIAILAGDPFAVNANSSMEFNYVVQSDPIPLNPIEAEAVNLAFRQGVIDFELDGTSRTHWRVGFIRSVRFWLHLHCRLRLPINRSVIYPRCNSRST